MDKVSVTRASDMPPISMLRHKEMEASRRSRVFASLLPVAFLLGLGVGYLSWGRSSASPTVTPPPVAGAQQPAQGAVKRYNVSTDDDPAIGPSNAPITLIEFSDFQCPYCRSWHEQVYNRLRQEYPDKVRIVYRDFPLFSIHPDAEPAAEAANCANEQGKFWEFSDRLFSGSQLGEQTYLGYANDLGLDLDKFKTCIQSGRFRDEVMGDYQYASSLGVQSTPTFFLNGLPLVGAQPYEVFKQVIDKELAGEIPK